MKADVILMLIGGMLLATGIIGGGFEVKELKVPKVGRMTRFFAICSGAALMLLGIGMVMTGTEVPGPPDPSPVATEEPIAQEQSAQFTIVDQLGEAQVSEQVTILIDGERAGTLTVNVDFPTDELTLTAPSEGPYSYHVEGQATFYDPSTDTIFPATGAGQGSIYVTDGAVFDLAGSYSGSNWVITLVEQDSA